MTAVRAAIAAHGVSTLCSSNVFRMLPGNCAAAATMVT